MKDYFIVVSGEAIKKGLKGFELLIYSLIDGFTSKNHVCYYNFKSLGRLVGCSEKQARRCICSLLMKDLIWCDCNKGWITWSLADLPTKDKVSQVLDKMSQSTDKVSWDGLLDELDNIEPRRY